MEELKLFCAVVFFAMFASASGLVIIIGQAVAHEKTFNTKER